MQINIYLEVLKMAQEDQSFYDMIPRINEKIKIMSKRDIELEKKIENIHKNNLNIEVNLGVLEKRAIEIESIKKYLHELEIRIKSIEIAQNGSSERNRTIINFVFQTIWVILTSYLLMKIGLTEGLGIL
jgi:hypothetical protein